MEPNKDKKKGAYCPPPCEACGAVVGLETQGVRNVSGVCERGHTHASTTGAGSGAKS